MIETSKSGEKREHAVPCQTCAGMTWNWSAVCDLCRQVDGDGDR